MPEARLVRWLALLDDVAERQVYLGPNLADGLADALVELGAQVVGPGASGDATVPAREGCDLALVAPDPTDGLDQDELARVAHALSESGRVACLLENPRDPMKLLARTRRSVVHPSSGVSLRNVMDQLEQHRWPSFQVFGLLRETAAPVMAFDLAAPEVVTAVLRASVPHIHGARGIGIALIRRLARVTDIRRLMPGWLVIATRATRAPDPFRITGMISNRDSRELKIVRGSGPDVLDKRYLDARHAESEASALTVLADAGLDLAPRLLRRPGPTANWMEWRSGAPLAVHRLSRGNRTTWVGRASAALAEIQRATARPGTGQVLVHGDFWLGNLLVSGDRIVAVIDWTDAHWGPPEVDLMLLRRTAGQG